MQYPTRFLAQAATIIGLFLGHGHVHAQPVPASLIVGSGDAAFELVADTPGLFGNLISFEMLSGPLSGPLSVSVLDRSIVVRLAVDASGIFTSTANHVVAALNADPNSAGLIGAAVLGSGFGIEAPFAATFLSGGAAVSPIPEPETYAMLLAGLGLLGFAMRRRRGRQHSAA